jgi:hypothetical protein
VNPEPLDVAKGILIGLLLGGILWFLIIWAAA